MTDTLKGRQESGAPDGLTPEDVETVDSGVTGGRPEWSYALVEVYGEDVGRRIDLDDAGRAWIGRLDENDVVVDNVSVSRRHAEIVVHEHGATVFDRGSTNGVYVNDTRVTECPLRHGDLLKIGSTLFKVLTCEHPDSAYTDELNRLATIDGLTQVMNRRRFMEQVERALVGARADESSVSVVVLQIERFDELVERYRELAADRVLSLLAGLVSQRLRRSDELARVGRSRFAVLLPGATPNVASQLAEKVRRHIELSTFRYNQNHIPVTVQVGWSSAERGDVSSEVLLEIAESDLGR
jgi:diguanylate cyclase (GGDEF)-like protein